MTVQECFAVVQDAQRLNLYAYVIGILLAFFVGREAGKEAR